MHGVGALVGGVQCKLMSAVCVNVLCWQCVSVCIAGLVFGGEKKEESEKNMVVK